MTERDAVSAAARGATALRELAEAVVDAEQRAWAAEAQARDAERRLAAMEDAMTDESELRETYRRGYLAGRSAARRAAPMPTDPAQSARRLGLAVRR